MDTDTFLITTVIRPEADLQDIAGAPGLEDGMLCFDYPDVEAVWNWWNLLTEEERRHGIPKAVSLFGRQLADFFQIVVQHEKQEKALQESLAELRKRGYRIFAPEGTETISKVDADRLRADIQERRAHLAQEIRELGGTVTWEQIEEIQRELNPDHAE